MANEQTSRPLEKTLEELFDINVERRMRTAIFVQALYPELTLVEALEKLRDPKFLLQMIRVLRSFKEDDPTEDVEESLAKVKALFAARYETDEEE